MRLQIHVLKLCDCTQIDMRLEAINLAKFSANFSRRKDIVFPYPYMHLTRRKILVESFHDGSPISNYLEHDDTILQRKLAKIGVTTILKMVKKINQVKQFLLFLLNLYIFAIFAKILNLHVLNFWDRIFGHR